MQRVASTECDPTDIILLQFFKNLCLRLFIEEKPTIWIPGHRIVAFLTAMVTSCNPEDNPQAIPVEHIIFCYIMVTHLHTFPFCNFCHLGIIESGISLDSRIRQISVHTINLRQILASTYRTHIHRQLFMTTVITVGK